MRARAWIAGLPTSSIVLIATNLVPLAGVLFLGWDLQTILVMVAKIVIDLRLHARERTNAAHWPLLANPGTA
jgi:hypothetical protein